MPDFKNFFSSLTSPLVTGPALTGFIRGYTSEKRYLQEENIKLRDKYIKELQEQQKMEVQKLLGEELRKQKRAETKKTEAQTQEILSKIGKPLSELDLARAEKLRAEAEKLKKAGIVPTIPPGYEEKGITVTQKGITRRAVPILPGQEVTLLNYLMNGEMLTKQVAKGKHIPIKLYTYLDASKIRAQLKTPEAQGLADEIMAYYPKRESYLLPERWHFRGPENMPPDIRKELIRRINELGTKRSAPTAGVGSLGLIPPPIK